MPWFRVQVYATAMRSCFSILTATEARRGRRVRRHPKVMRVTVDLQAVFRPAAPTSSESVTGVNALFTSIQPDKL